MAGARGRRLRASAHSADDESQVPAFGAAVNWTQVISLGFAIALTA
jgi:hypothetical protein